MPDDTQNPLGGAQALENRFESAWQSGAFDSQNPAEAAQLQAERKGESPEQTAASQRTNEPSKEDSGEATAAPEAEYVNLDDYLQKAGLERDSFYSLPVRVKDQDITLSDLLKRAEVERDVHQETTALADRRKAFETESAQQTQAFNEKLKFAESLGNIAYQELVREYNQVDWNSLAQTDPGRAALLQTQFQQRNAVIQNQLQQIQAQHQEHGKQEQAKFQANLKVEQDKLLKAFPEWRDQTKFQAARDLMSSYAKDRGFSDEEVNSIFDHRYMQVLHDAAQWRQLQSKNAAALKKVRAAPQISNPGARVTKDPAVTKSAETRKAFHKDPKSVDNQLAWANDIASRLS